MIEANRRPPRSIIVLLVVAIQCGGPTSGGHGTSSDVGTGTGDSEASTSTNTATESSTGGDTDGAPICAFPPRAPVVPVWTATFDAQGGDDSVGRVAVDGDGNVVVGGAVTIAGQQSDIWVGKYSIDGTLLWSRTHDGETHEIDGTNDVGVDGDGNVFVLGTVFTSDPTLGLIPTLWVRKYHPDGAVSWTDTTPVEAPNPSVLSNALTVRSDGTIVIAGSGPSSAGFLRAYDADGGALWTIIEPEVRPLELASDEQGDIYVAGHDGTFGMVERRNSSGGLIWSRATPGTGQPDHESGAAVAVAAAGGQPSGAVVFAGIENYLIGSPMDPRESWNELFVLALDGYGDVSWVRTFDHDGWPQLDVSADPFYLLSSSRAGPLVRYLRHYDGALVWTFLLPCPHRAFNMAVALGGPTVLADLHVAGRIDTARHGTDLFVGRFAPVP